MDQSRSVSPPPAGAEESAGAGTRLVGGFLQLVAAAGLVLWFAPEWIGIAGFEEFGSRLARDQGLRFTLLPILTILLIVSHFMARSGRVDARLAKRRQQALELGGEIVEARGLGPGGAWVDGPGLRLEVAGRALTVTTTLEGSGKHRSKRTRAVVAVETRDLFGFQAIGSKHASRLLGGLGRAAIGHGMREVLKRATREDERLAAESVQYLAGPPQSLPADAAEVLELRSNDPDRAARLLGAPGVIGALRALDLIEPRWEWTLYPTRLAGQAELTVTLPGSASDVEVIRAVQALQQTALSALDQARAA